MSTLSIYGAGGAGINILKHFIPFESDGQQGMFPVTRKYALDSSDSNSRDLPEDVQGYQVPGLRGAGKRRRTAYAGVEDKIADIVNSHKPSDFNIVIFSASGGTGSVIGPLVAAELLRRGASVCVIVIGSVASGEEAKNTRDTLLGLQSMIAHGKTEQRPIAMYYQENLSSVDATGASYRHSRPNVDVNVEQFIKLFGMLICGNHEELDHSDVVNWMDYTVNNPMIPPQLVEVIPFLSANGEEAKHFGENIKEYDGQVFSLASVMSSDGDEAPSLGQPYSTAGYYRDSHWGQHNPPNLHAIITSRRVEHQVGSVSMAVTEFDAIKERLASRPAVALHGDADDKSGLMF